MKKLAYIGLAISIIQLIFAIQDKQINKQILKQTQK